MHDRWCHFSVHSLQWFPISLRVKVKMLTKSYMTCLTLPPVTLSSALYTCPTPFHCTGLLTLPGISPHVSVSVICTCSLCLEIFSPRDLLGSLTSYHFEKFQLALHSTPCSLHPVIIFIRIITTWCSTC